MILSDRSDIFSIPLRGCESFFVEKSRRYGEKSKFLKKFFLNDLAAAYSLSFKLGNNLLLCKISASNSQPSSVYKERTHTHTEIEIYI